MKKEFEISSFSFAKSNKAIKVSAQEAEETNYFFALKAERAQALGKQLLIMEEERKPAF
jgi:hypothetical protein